MERERFPSTVRLFVGLLIGVIMLVGALTFFPALALGPDRRAFRHVSRAFLQVKELSMVNSSIWNPASDSARRSADAIKKLNPRIMMKNPVMFVVEIGSVLTTIAFSYRSDAWKLQRRALQRPDHALALVYRTVRQFRRSHGGRSRQSAGRKSAKGPHRNKALSCGPLTGSVETVTSSRASKRRRGRG